jgi:hypothetical protein
LVKQIVEIIRIPNINPTATKKSKIDEKWPPREQLLADDHGVRNHRRRLIDHELVGQSAAVRIFGVARVCFMQKAVLSKHDLWL